MPGQLTIIKTTCRFVLGVATLVFVTGYVFSELYRWYSTGELLGLFGARGSPKYWRIITYESDPLNFVLIFALDLVCAAVGVALCFGIFVMIRQWWNHKRTIE